MVQILDYYCLIALAYLVDKNKGAPDVHAALQLHWRAEGLKVVRHFTNLDNLLLAGFKQWPVLF